ncbi:unnamed protein product [Didymodactylos carnosus]|uniref:Uncharacterized protein n=1 Tax=Didymodactylos carnosus TaxID=1234261 RepID=A0A815CFT4_9BILA|nr:unnamed protein product [Didymodactylos carnosus]CAF4080280.1 unnamed protein product [Didymodactylos carnosus]
MYHLHKSFKVLIKPVTSIKDLFEILIDSKYCSDDKKKKKSSIFFNKPLKIKVTNNQNKSLYLHFSETQDSEQIKFDDQEQLINLLKYGRKSLVKMKKNSNKSLKFKYQLSDLDFQQLIRDLLDKIDQQESKFLELIQLFKNLELVNENEYKKLDENFRKLLPETRFWEISKSVKEFQTFLNPLKSRFKEINRKILQLIFLRENIYRQNHYFYLEELEFLTILTHQKTNIDHNLMIYYRLSYLYKLKGDLQMAIHYINLASQKYNEKINKKIFKKNGKVLNKFIKIGKYSNK